MNRYSNVKINRIKNYLSRHRIEENEDNFSVIKKVIRKKKMLDL